jgi:hypothetical protein
MTGQAGTPPRAGCWRSPSGSLRPTPEEAEDGHINPDLGPEPAICLCRMPQPSGSDAMSLFCPEPACFARLNCKLSSRARPLGPAARDLHIVTIPRRARGLSRLSRHSPRLIRSHPVNFIHPVVAASVVPRRLPAVAHFTFPTDVVASAQR